MIRTECAQCLQRDACGGPRSQQGRWASVPEMDGPIADLDLPGTAVSQIDDLCGHLCRKAKRVCRMRWCRLQPVPGLCGDRLRYRIRVRRKSAECGVRLRDIVDPASDSPDLSGFGQAAQGLIHSSAIAEIIEHPGTKYCHWHPRRNAIQESRTEVSHVRNIFITFLTNITRSLRTLTNTDLPLNWRLWVFLPFQQPHRDLFGTDGKVLHVLYLRQCARLDRDPKETTAMKTFVLDADHNIRVYAFQQQASSDVPPGDAFTTAAGLKAALQNYPDATAVEIWKSLTGVTPLKRFKETANAAERIVSFRQLTG